MAASVPEPMKRSSPTRKASACRLTASPAPSCLSACKTRARMACMLLRLAIASLGLCLASTLAEAQAVETGPIMGSQSAEELAVQPVDDTYRILVIGDALAGGLGAGLSRMAEPEPRFEIVNRFQETSGIARPEVYDWPASLPKIMEGKEFKAVVVLMGAYDRQAIREGDFRLVFNTPEWKAAYEARIDQLLDVLNAAGLKVFWVAIPPMGDA